VTSANPTAIRGVAPARLREGRAPVRERLMAMLFLTALLHAIVILGVGFSVSGHAGGNAAPQLDVMLVTDDVPQARDNPHAAYLAQRTQIGAGDTDAQHPPGSPASRGAQHIADQPVDGSDDASRAPHSTAPTQRVLASSGASPDIRYFGELATPEQAAALPQMLGDAPGAPRSGRGDAPELLLRGKANAEHWISPDTRASRLAPYLAEWKRKVERVGTLNFPSAARRAGLSGSPVLEVEIGADGRLRQARVRRSSGYGALDEAALTILRLASPFNPFPPDLAAQYSRLRFAYQWDFVSGNLASATSPVEAATPNTLPVTAPAAGAAPPQLAAPGSTAALAGP
jgi:protein TonB